MKHHSDLDTIVLKPRYEQIKRINNKYLKTPIVLKLAVLVLVALVLPEFSNSASN